MILELFPCSGGMAEGFRRAGLAPGIAFDVHPDACDSYERNLGHRPIQMDVRDLLRLVQRGWRPTGDYAAEDDGMTGLIVADPPCTPWSRAGKRLGTDDERDMLLVTVELIRLLRPRAYLIGNVPGLDDAPNWPTLQRALAPLAEAGYCIADYWVGDAASFGVPQHRRRPFWFGHLAGPCITWPTPTHGDPDDPAVHSPLPGMGMRPWVTCRDALGHLPPEELGRTVRMRTRRTETVADPKRTSSRPRASFADEPAHTVTSHPTAGDGNILVAACSASQHVLLCHKRHPVNKPDAPSYTVTARGDGRGAQGACVLEWPWNRPATTVKRDERIPPPGHHDEYATRSMPNAVVLSERAAAILQGFPDQEWVFSGKTKTSRWGQIGMAVPPALAEAVARAVKAQMEAR